MTDSTGEEQPDGPPENSSDLDTPATRTNNPNQDIDNMEVHHHAHHEGKKNWKAYFWEFLMLFLAVFCGFLAEYKLEHTLEHQRAGEYAISLVQDLQNDTIAINIHKKTAEIFIANTDSLLRLGQTSLEGRNAAEFSFYTRFLYWTAPFPWNRTTFEQVKSSGNLRYFTNFKLLNKLMKYDAIVKSVEGEFSNHQTRGNMLLKLIDEIIDPQLHHDLSKYQLSLLDTMSAKTKEEYFTVETASLEGKRVEIRELLNMAVVQQRNLRFNEIRLLRAKDLAAELIADLKKEYHIE